MQSNLNYNFIQFLFETDIDVFKLYKQTHIISTQLPTSSYLTLKQPEMTHFSKFINQ